MSHSFYKLWFHLVWGTKDREPLLLQEIRPLLFKHLIEKATAEDYTIDSVNGMADHVHCLISIPPKYSISEVMNKLKGESSHWINSEKLTKFHFAWQTGFGAFSVSESQAENVRRYINNQEQHHVMRTYAEEVEEFVRLYHAQTSEHEVKA